MIISKIKRTKSSNAIVFSQRVNVICDSCTQIYSRTYSNIMKVVGKYGSMLCRSCCLNSQYASGSRDAQRLTLHTNMYGYSLEERIGKEKADKAKHNISLSCSGKNNHMYGSGKWNGPNHNKHLASWKDKTFEEIFGYDRAQLIKAKLSAASSGKSNPMYGRPAPTGSGNGWSGWYRSIYFRSLLELSYMVHLTNGNIRYESAELKKFRVEYGNKTYCPDFHLVDTNEVVEVKPKHLVTTCENIEKFDAAQLVFGNRFKIVTEESFPVLSNEELFNLRETGEVVFISRYEDKFKERFFK